MRLFHLFVVILMTSIKRELAFRTNFVFQLLIVASTTLSALVSIGIVYTQTETLGGWNRGESIVLLGTYLVIGGVLATFIEPNVLWFSEQITNGRLDDILLRPVPSLFLATLGNHAPTRLLQVLAGTLVIPLGLFESGNAPRLWHIVSWITMMSAAIAITWATRTMLTVIALWAPSLTLDVVYDAAWQFGRYPVSIYKQPFRFALTYVVPLAFITTLPAQALARGIDIEVLLAGMAFAVVAIVAVQTAWKVGLRRYTSATS